MFIGNVGKDVVSFLHWCFLPRSHTLTELCAVKDLCPEFFATECVQVFYAACQGLLYVSCYRLEQLVESQEVGARDEIRNLFQHSIPLLLQSR